MTTEAAGHPIALGPYWLTAHTALTVGSKDGPRELSKKGHRVRGKGIDTLMIIDAWPEVAKFNIF